jgi:hypothetical protein
MLYHHQLEVTKKKSGNDGEINYNQCFIQDYSKRVRPFKKHWFEGRYFLFEVKTYEFPKIINRSLLICKQPYLS